MISIVVVIIVVVFFFGIIFVRIRGYSRGSLRKVGSKVWLRVQCDVMPVMTHFTLVVALALAL